MEDKTVGSKQHSQANLHPCNSFYHSIRLNEEGKDDTLSEMLFGHYHDHAGYGLIGEMLSDLSYESP